MVMPRAFSSGALSISSYATCLAKPLSASTFVIAAVSVVLPWSTWPMVPMLRCSFVRLLMSYAKQRAAPRVGRGAASAQGLQQRRDCASVARRRTGGG